MLYPGFVIRYGLYVLLFALAYDPAGAAFT